MKRATSTRFKTAAILSVAIVGTLAAVGWGVNPFPASPASAAAAPQNMKAYMVDAVGPATQPIWEGSYADKLTDQDWAKMQKAAADLVGTIPTITAGGRVAAEQTRAKTPMWQDWTKKLSEQANLAKRAADRKDQMAMATAGDAMLEVCEGCHMAFDPTAR